MVLISWMQSVGPQTADLQAGRSHCRCSCTNMKLQLHKPSCEGHSVNTSSAVEVKCWQAEHSKPEY